MPWEISWMRLFPGETVVLSYVAIVRSHSLARLDSRSRNRTLSHQMVIL